MKLYQIIKVRKPVGVGSCMCGCQMPEVRYEDVEIKVEYDTEKEFFENQKALEELKVRLQREIDESDEAKKIEDKYHEAVQYQKDVRNPMLTKRETVI